MRWPHRALDWELALRHAEGLVAERDGQVVGTGLRWRWGPQQATIGLVIVSPACQGRRIGHRLMTALLQGLEGCSVLLQATSEGRGLYERLGFVRTGEIRQHQGVALPAPLIALSPGRRLRPATGADLPALHALDAAARGMPRAGADRRAVPRRRRHRGTGRRWPRARLRDAAPLRPRPRDRAGGRARCRRCAGADRAPGRAERWPLHAHRPRLRQRPDRVGGKPGPAARGCGDDHGARRPAGARRRRPALRHRHAGARDDAAGLRLQGRRPARPAVGRSLPPRSARTSTSGSGPRSATRNRCVTSPRG